MGIATLPIYLEVSSEKQEIVENEIGEIRWERFTAAPTLPNGLLSYCS